MGIQGVSQTNAQPLLRQLSQPCGLLLEQHGLRRLALLEHDQDWHHGDPALEIRQLWPLVTDMATVYGDGFDHHSYGRTDVIRLCPSRGCIVSVYLCFWLRRSLDGRAAAV